MIIGLMTVCQMTVWQITVWQMNVCRMTVECPNFAEMTCVCAISARGHVTDLLRYVST